jgi:hypothetical protein
VNWYKKIAIRIADIFMPILIIKIGFLKACRWQAFKKPI